MYYQNETDETLVLLTLAGEQKAYEVLVLRYQHLTVNSAMAVTKNHFMAEDAAQDAFVTAWMKLDTLQEPKKYASWVCRIAKNCALNMIKRYRSFIPIDTVENTALSDFVVMNPSEIYALSEEKDDVNRSIERLPDKVRKTIQMHYYEGLSIAEIADKMRVSEGTVKWQLHDGRKRIRKELCAMDEKYSDTLVQRVMKKVEELKLWQVKKEKSGFEKVYNEVLREVETLHECKEKHHALADVLMRGWWWIPGKKNEALYARIVDAATQGKNEEVMSFIVAREDSQVYGGALIEFIRDKQIPRLEKSGFVKTLGREWFWLGYNCMNEGKTEEGNKAYKKVLEILDDGDAYKALVSYAIKMHDVLKTSYKEIPQKQYLIGASAEEYRYIDNSIRYWKNEGFGEGYMSTVDRDIMHIFCNSSKCDGYFFADIPLGESFVGTDETTLTYVSDNEVCDTPAGRFESCQLWVTRCWDNRGKSLYKSYYKEGVGIVRHEHIIDGVKDTRVLCSYNIKGGTGLLPIHKDNTWVYSAEYSTSTIESELEFTVSYSDKDRVIISSWENARRLGYDENSWIDMIGKVRWEYWKEDGDNQYLQNVLPDVERAEQLASTKMEKAHTKVMASAMRRILATDTTQNPNYTATGHWNFFCKIGVRKKRDAYVCAENPRWSFEWKYDHVIGIAGEPILFNDILGILQDATNCIWSDEWRIGASPIVEYTNYSNEINTKIVCEEGGCVKTKAGRFDNCLKLSLDVDGMDGGLLYRAGKKVYYFANGVGIVRVENEYSSGARTAVYELTSYTGTSDGYMPLADGLWRRYDAVGLTDGFVGAAEYTYVADDEGDIVIFEDRTGIKNVFPPITQYSFIEDERIEDRLWEEGKYEESRLRHDVNNFHLICHFLGRPSRYWAAQGKAVAWNKYRLKLLESLCNDGNVPDAWLGLYASTSFRTACALFGCGKKEEGYAWLDKAFEAYPKWDNIPDGTEMDVGDPLIYGGIKVIKGKEYMKLPDGSVEALSDPDIFDGNCQLMYYGMTAAHGWEWFNSVRDEDRFKEYIEKARKMVDKK